MSCAGKPFNFEDVVCHCEKYIFFLRRIRTGTCFCDRVQVQKGLKLMSGMEVERDLRISLYKRRP